MRALILTKKRYEPLANNVGNADKIVRIMISIELLLGVTYLPYVEYLEELVLVVSLSVFSTALIGYCPVYAMVRMSTNKNG